MESNQDLFDRLIFTEYDIVRRTFCTVDTDTAPIGHRMRSGRALYCTVLYCTIPLQVAYDRLSSHTGVDR